MMNMPSNLLSVSQLAYNNGVPEAEVNCRMCSFCHLATIDFDRKTCICVRWDEKVRLNSFCSQYTRQYDRVG